MRSHSLIRRGNALLICVIVLGAVATVLFGAISRLEARHSLERMDRLKGNAEQVAMMVARTLESRLKQVAQASQMNLTKNLVADLDLKWLSRGYVDGTTTDVPGVWVDGTLVYWRVEPLRAYDRTLSDTDHSGRIDGAEVTSAGAQNYLINLESDISKGHIPGVHEIDNPGLYMYEVTVQAFSMRTDSKNLNLAGKAPVQIPNAFPMRKDVLLTDNSAQVKRKVIVKYRRLFEHILFYHAQGVTGDLEIHPGPDMVLIGSVHTNGALYCGLNGATVAMGSSVEVPHPAYAPWIPDLDAVRITAVDGFFRMKKCNNFTAGGLTQPMSIAPGSSLSDKNTANPVYFNATPLKYTDLTFTTTPPGMGTITTKVPVPSVASKSSVIFRHTYDSRQENQDAGTAFQPT